MIFRPSGGLLYHWRAWRSPALWRGFREPLAAWLESWPTPYKQLLLIGPSGGYTLPERWLKRFQTVVAYDIDPLAARILPRRHAISRVHRQDLFWHGGRLSLTPLTRALSAHPHATVLFSNVLGQLPLEGQVSEKEWRDYLVGLRAQLGGRVWASYHDLWTLKPLPQAHHAAAFRGFLQHGDFRSGLQGVRRVDAIDHLMSGSWSEGLERTHFAWSLSKTHFHIIEGTRAR